MGLFEHKSISSAALKNKPGSFLFAFIAVISLLSALFPSAITLVAAGLDEGIIANASTLPKNANAEGAIRSARSPATGWIWSSPDEGTPSPPPPTDNQNQSPDPDPDSDPLTSAVHPSQSDGGGLLSKQVQENEDDLDAGMQICSMNDPHLLACNFLDFIIYHSYYSTFALKNQIQI
jgi:hypothetical protein